ncbi:hypothetical protein MCQ_00485, partial [Candidatus Bartonella washoeensis Sb944nv]
MEAVLTKPVFIKSDEILLVM